MTAHRLPLSAAIRSTTRVLPSVAVLLFAALGFLGLLEIVGPCVWDPVELDLAELARAHQTPPQELAFASRAVGAAFRVLGVSAWAGRLPMLVMSLVGAFGAFAFARRFGAKRASYFVLLVLATAPAYALPSRVIGGQIVPVASSMVAFAALAVATFAVDLRGTRRAALFIVAILACAVCASSRGLAVGVGVPAAAVGLGALLHTRGAHDDPSGRSVRTRGVVLAVLAVSVLAVSLVSAVWASAPHAIAAATLGPEHAALRTPSFEAAWALLGTSLFPWSAVLPLALAGLSRRAPRGIETPVGDHEARSGARTALAAWLVLALFMHGALAQRDATAPFVAVGGVALALGMALAELDARALQPWSGRVLSVLTLAVVAYLACDEVTRAPAKALLMVTAHPLAPFGAAMEKDVTRAFRLSALALCALALVPALATALADLAGLRVRKRAVVPASLVPMLRRAASRPGTFLLAGGISAGLLLRVGLYPQMLRAFAPDTALSVFAAKARPGERLGLFGVSQRTLAYVHDAPTSTVKIASATEAVSLLTPVAPGAGALPSGSAQPPRTFVALTQKDLPSVNALYRKEHGVNLPILGGPGERGSTSDTVLLATSALLPAEINANTISVFLKEEAPAMQRPLGVDFGGKLETLGWELTEDDGAPLVHVPPRGSFHVKIALRVTEPPGAGYCTFIHLEHTPTRMTAEHKDFAAYPMTLWQRGDVVIDDFAIKLSPQFGAGRYTLFYGVGLLPCEDDKRLAVTRGPSDGHDRARAGDLEVR